MQNNKPFTLGYNLKKKHLPSQAVKEDHSLDTYIEYLKQEGIWVHPSIKPAMFSLTNGLLYPGLKTEEELAGPHILVKIPEKMLLTTNKANIPQLEKLFQEPFYSCKYQNWEDRIILTFLLYTYAKQQQSLWKRMVEQLSKEIDILRFWPKEDIKLLKDQKVESICAMYRQDFQQEFAGFMNTIENHPGLISSEYLTKQNYKWLYIHLVSRSFGQFLEHVTMVPFCQLFNHHNSDVLYDFLYDQTNPNKHLQTKLDHPDKYATEQSRAEIQSSDRSYDSQQYFDDDEFNYTNIEIHKIKWGGKMSFYLKDKQTKQVEDRYKQLDEWLEQQLCWKDQSIMLVAQVVEKMNITKNQYMAGRKKFPETIQSFTKLKQTCNIYKMKLIQFYKFIKGDKFDYRKFSEPQKPEPIPEQRFKSDKFDYFTMRMNKRDHFLPNNQVYFCYGRLSNRLMLQRYGMALEGNKYDHIWISLPIIPFIQGYPDTIEKMQNKKDSIKRKFKLKRRQISLELLVFYKMSKWSLIKHNINNIFKVLDLDKEIEALDLCIKLVQRQRNGIDDVSILEQKLKDPNVGYHEYFGIVYQLQHRRILDLHYNAYNQMKQIIESMIKGQKTQDILKRKYQDLEDKEMKWYLSKYFQMIQES